MELGSRVFRYGEKEVFTDIYKLSEGYAIISYMQGRCGRLQRTDYANSDKYNDKTQWSVEKLLEHGIEESIGIINPVMVYS